MLVCALAYLSARLFISKSYCRCFMDSLSMLCIYYAFVVSAKFVWLECYSDVIVLSYPQLVLLLGVSMVLISDGKGIRKKGSFF